MLVIPRGRRGAPRLPAWPRYGPQPPTCSSRSGRAGALLHMPRGRSRHLDSVQTGRFRMRVTLVVLVALVVLVGAVDGARAEETPRMGGVLKVATIGEPPTLDIPMSTATQVFEIMWHVNEGLFTYDRNWNPIPHLAESYTLTDGARRYTIALRRGV